MNISKSLLWLSIATVLVMGCSDSKKQEPELTVKTSHPSPIGIIYPSGGFGVDLDIFYTGNAMASLIHIEAYKNGERTQEMLEVAGFISGPEASPGRPIENMKTSITIHDSKTSNFKLREDPDLGGDFFLITHISEWENSYSSGSKRINRNVYEPIGKSRSWGKFSEYDLTQTYIPIYYISSPGVSLKLKDGQPDVPSQVDCIIFYLQLQYK